MRFYTNAIVIGDNILAREVVDGKRVNHRIPYSPTLYFPTPNRTDFRTVDGTYCEPIKYTTISEARDSMKQYEGVGNFPVYGNTTYNFAWLAETYPEPVVEYDIRQICNCSLDIETESERGYARPDNPTERINAIAFRDISKNKTYVFGLEAYDQMYCGSVYDHVEYVGFDDEESLLLAFVNTWSAVAPDIITGWNVSMFDIPYIINRLTMLFGPDASKRLSPWGKIRATTIRFMNNDHTSYEISGVSVLDYLRLYKKYTNDPRENFKLGYICQVELGKTKVAHDEFENFAEFYKKDFQKFIDYNIEDSLLIEELESKLKLIDLTLMLAYEAHCNYEDVFSQVRTWDCIIYNYLHRKGIVIPQKTESGKDSQYAGAYVKEPKPGLHRWMVSFDVTSLYPSIIKALNIGNETKVGIGDRLTPEDFLTSTTRFKSHFDIAADEELTLAVNGCRYRKDHISFFSEMIEKMFKDRVEFRKQLKICKENADHNGASKFDLKQMAKKIQMNSLYGAMGNEYFRFFDIENAEAVTLSGQFIIQFIERGMNAYLNKMFKTEDKAYVVYCDTDSVYITMDEIVQKILPDADVHKVTSFLNKFAEDKVEKEIDRLFQQIEQEYLNAVPGHLKMKREVIANIGIWTGKKRYLLNCFDIEGELYGLADTIVKETHCKDCLTLRRGCKKHAEPKLKAMGIEIKKATCPAFCRKKMEQAVKIILNTGDQEKLIDFIEATREEFEQLPPHEIAFPRGVNGVGKNADDDLIYVKGTPLNAKAALNYNHMLKKHNLEKRYAPIQDGEKIKYIFLKEPNPLRDKVIAFLSKLPTEFGLETYIDYNHQFQKSFIEPLELILKAIGWESERRSSLAAFF